MFIPPVTGTILFYILILGDYKFLVSGDGITQFYLSTESYNIDPINLKKIVDHSGNSAFREYFEAS
jgi:hypothetical protein